MSTEQTPTPKHMKQEHQQLILELKNLGCATDRIRGIVSETVKAIEYLSTEIETIRDEKLKIEGERDCLVVEIRIMRENLKYEIEKMKESSILETKSTMDMAGKIASLESERANLKKRVEDLNEANKELRSLVAKAVNEQRSLAEWKGAMLAVESEWNPQEIGEMLGMALGASIRKELKPSIEKLINQNSILKNDNQHLQERLTGIRNLIIARNQIGKQIRNIAGVQTWEGVRRG